ncbi:myb-like DNA-binding domain-containing protein, putative [Eimeria praecox]|uniref:Myb-like DNA-binding domain-containing protein, putative n=1 Tax=Eimeria praecox TaxID=51316 RepID=U6GX98_9EIME|nr:myb-like DNA-binding domain-containing protein, putative [Eimeria praecox]
MVRIFIKGGVWRNSEDEILKAAVMKYGLNNWSRVASLLVKKSAKQCKARWYEWLDPSVKKTEWTLEEEEKLLHLAKIMPSQWRTIAPITVQIFRLSRHDMDPFPRVLVSPCSEGMEGEEGKPSGTGFSQAPGSRKAPGRGVGFLRGREDPRRLRPGEIDPHPETKPSRADPIDMAEDEKEMLEEARARLANTRGKKAKRKAREKQLEEARRLAALQKKRELKAAGIITGAKRRTRKNFQPYDEVPFEEKPPPGFYEVPAEENPEGNMNFANISVQHMEGTMRAREEQKLRKDDARKLKRLREDHLDEYLKMQEEKLKKEAIAKKMKLNLPEPMLKEHELEELVRLGAEASLLTGADGHDETSTLLAQGLSTPSTVISRIPRRSERVQQEARNALALLGIQTPLEGEENAQIEEVQGGKGLTPGDVRTPNALQQQLRGSRLTGTISDTPLTAATRITSTGHGTSATPLNDPSDAGSASEGGGMGSKAELQLARLQARTSLASLPAPRNDVTGQIPDDITEEEKELLESEADLDMEEVEKRRAQRAAEAERRRFLEQTQVMQQQLPRPILPPPKPLTPSIDAASAIAAAVQEQLQHDDDTVITDEGKDAAVAAISEAASLTENIMSLLVQHDCYEHPFRGVNPPPPAGELEPCSLEEMQAARELVETELASWGLDENYPRLDKLVYTLETQLVFNPATKSYVSSSTLSPNEKLQVYAHQVETLKSGLASAVQRTKKLEKKYKVLTTGYTNRQKELAKAINEKSAELLQLDARIASFTRLHDAERKAVKTRTEEKRLEVLRERAKHLFLQQLYGRLTSVKNHLQELLSGTATQQQQQAQA